MDEKKKITRRNFVGTMAAAGTGILAGSKQSSAAAPKKPV